MRSARFKGTSGVFLNAGMRPLFAVQSDAAVCSDAGKALIVQSSKTVRGPRENAQRRDRCRDNRLARGLTLAALVPAAAHGTVRDVILVDRHASPAMERVADVAGCHLENISGSRGAALTQGASIARGPWLMFIAPGAVLEPGWADDVTRFIEAMEHDGTMRAATFTSVPDPHEPLTVTARLRGLLHALRANGDGLVIRKTFYEKLRGHRADAAIPNAI